MSSMSSMRGGLIISGRRVTVARSTLAQLASRPGCSIITPRPLHRLRLTVPRLIHTSPPVDDQNTSDPQVSDHQSSGATVSSSSSPTQITFSVQGTHGQSTNLHPEIPRVVPPPETKSHRTLVLCLDGTGEQFDEDNSNIVQFFSMLSKNDPNRQMVYYQAGIGTYAALPIVTKGMMKLSMMMDIILAKNLEHHIMSAYEFLMQNYKKGDRICLFGFSRGAYTARALSGMIHKVGLIPRGNRQQVRFAYRMYTQDNEQGWEQSKLFKKTFSMDVEVEFVGVWDTVSSVGLIPRRLPFTKSNNAIRTFRHAVSLDERRIRFSPSLYKHTESSSLHYSEDQGHNPVVPNGSIPASATHGRRRQSQSIYGRDHHHHHHDHEERYSRRKQKRDPLKRHELERLYANFSRTTDAVEVWFSGCHSDVGGGSVPNATRYSLARIPLRWMVRQCFTTNTGIQFNYAKLREIGLDPGMLYPKVVKRPPIRPLQPEEVDLALKDLTVSSANHSARPHTRIPPGSEEEEELRDALSPIYDQLTTHKWWWIMELVFGWKRYAEMGWKERWNSLYAVLRFPANLILTPNLGRARNVPDQQVEPLKVHRSVKMRMEVGTIVPAHFDTGNLKDYQPKLKFEAPPSWID